MADTSIYKDISERTGGNVYVGVVGPVRTGKSTFIKRFMESLVLPNISDGYKHDRARDELPQSAAGKTVMTTEPKFIPDEAVEINPSGAGKLRVRMIDCVGYMVDGAMGVLEEGHPRLVRTPWSEEPMPFANAAEEGTRKVICEHSTIGMVITSDGSIGEIPRESYVEAEERVIKELKELGKPFAVILNSSHPTSNESIALGHQLEEKYGIPVALVSCLVSAKICTATMPLYAKAAVCVGVPCAIISLFYGGSYEFRRAWEILLEMSGVKRRQKDSFGLTNRYKYDNI